MNCTITDTTRRSYIRTRREPAWHRRNRRRRTEARTLLRLFLAGAPTTQAAIEKAISDLATHHSASSLPRLVRARLSTMPGSMPWECGCGRLNKGASTYCGTCGHPWWETVPNDASYQTQTVATPWREAQHTWSQAPIPAPQAEGRQRSLTPRGRRRHKGKGTGKAKGKDEPPAPGTKPQPLPPPPKPPAVQFPPATASSSAASTAAEQHLGTLLTALQAQKGNLPPEVLQAVEGIALTSASQEAKGLHKAVTLQQKAKQELARIAAQRLSSSTAWAKYLQEVTETVQKQLQSHEASLKEMDEAESSWRQSLQEASMELSRLSDQRVGEEDEEMAAETVKAWDALASTRRQEQHAQQQQLMISLRQATETAASMASAAQRETSRTPRRTKRPLPDTSSPELLPGSAVKDESKEPNQDKLDATLQELSGNVGGQHFT